MALVYLIRHGRAAAAWDEDLDPGLDVTGHAQAALMAETMAPLGPLPILLSPLQRTRETAAPLEQRWAPGTVEARVAEVPSPALELGQRRHWLSQLMTSRWGAAEPSLGPWRQAILECLRAIRSDTVVNSHFVVINVALGAATGDDRVRCFRPGHCSRTVLEVANGELKLIEAGEERDTEVR